MNPYEKFNTHSHLIGTLLSFVGALILVRAAWIQGDPWKLFSFSLYGLCLVLLYLGSTLSHSVQGRWAEYFRRVDHCNIYLLIAGSYTPFTLVLLRDGPGWWIFGAVWVLAAIGIIQDLVIKHDPRILPVILYLVMGWLIIFAVQPLTEALAPEGFQLLLWGGISYTVGVLFFGLSRYQPIWHCVWHLFVLGGSTLHYFSVLLYVSPHV